MAQTTKREIYAEIPTLRGWIDKNLASLERSKGEEREKIIMELIHDLGDALAFVKILGESE